MPSPIALVARLNASERAFVLSVLSNCLFGYAIGRVLMAPLEELSASLVLKVFLVLGACLFAQHLLLLRQTCRGVLRDCRGRFRPVARDSLLCALVTGLAMLAATGGFLARLAWAS